MDLHQKTLEAIFKSNVEVRGLAYTPSGFVRITLDADDYKRYIEDRDQFAADYFKVNLETYHAWMKSHGTPQCGKITKKGTRCKKPSGRVQSSIEEWQRDEGEMCSLHFIL